MEGAVSRGSDARHPPRFSRGPAILPFLSRAGGLCRPAPFLPSRRARGSAPLQHSRGALFGALFPCASLTDAHTRPADPQGSQRKLPAPHPRTVSLEPRGGGDQRPPAFRARRAPRSGRRRRRSRDPAGKGRKKRNFFFFLKKRKKTKKEKEGKKTSFSLPIKC